MRSQEAKELLRGVTGKAKEALAEIGPKIAAQQAKITELEASINDPEVTDAETLELLADLKNVTEQLAGIVDVPANPPTENSGGSGEPATV